MIRAAVALLALSLPAMAQDRVLAIGGSVTEIVHALGQGDRLVGRDSTSTFPPQVTALPDVGYMRALSPEGVLSVAPDLILAEDGAGPPEAVAVLEQAGIPFHTMPEGHDAQALIAKIRAVAEALGTPEAAAAPIADLQGDLDRLAEVNRGVETPRRVMFVLSVQGGRIMAAGQGSGGDAIIRMAGAENAVQGFAGYQPLTDEAITAAAPEAIVMMTPSGARSDHDAPDAELLALPAIATTPAARAGALIRMDGLYLLGFGPRTGRAALDLHHAIYGDG
ncbi:hemin ABC transporter substrate-binding protein [Paracoccus nototheniae]|uniref:Hemin ABC transporter substrate-binding protein n=1 Tax=Paracoccus nototheniae TaxID=2489002 RepID=A0ABW4DSD2_9RHOB|nr:ABC transporter substrate-binding protein [Paracoccus nototheniae]